MDLTVQRWLKENSKNLSDYENEYIKMVYSKREWVENKVYEIERRERHHSGLEMKKRFKGNECWKCSDRHIGPLTMVNNRDW